MPLTKIKYHMIDDEALAQLAAGGGAASETTAPVLAQQNTGYIPAGDTVPTGTSLQEFLELLLTTTFYPVGHEPTASLSNGGVTLSQEAGSNISSLVLTGGYTAGYVAGKQNLTSGLWEPNTHQSDAWTGAVTKYTFSGTDLSSTDNGTTAALTVGAVQIPTSGLSYTVAINYAAGAYIMQNSKGVTKDDTGTDYVVHPSGSVSANLNFTSYRNSFYGVSSGTTVVPTDNASASSLIRALSGTHASPANGNTFTLNPVVGTTRVMFAYPATLRDVTSVIDSGTGYNIRDSFTKITYTVAGANGYDPISYKIYHFVPPAAFSAATTYTVTI